MAKIRIYVKDFDGNNGKKYRAYSTKDKNGNYVKIIFTKSIDKSKLPSTNFDINITKDDVFATFADDKPTIVIKNIQSIINAIDDVNKYIDFDDDDKE